MDADGTFYTVHPTRIDPYPIRSDPPRPLTGTLPLCYGLKMGIRSVSIHVLGILCILTNGHFRLPALVVTPLYSQGMGTLNRENRYSQAPLHFLHERWEGASIEICSAHLMYSKPLSACGGDAVCSSRTLRSR